MTNNERDKRHRIKMCKVIRLKRNDELRKWVAPKLSQPAKDQPIQLIQTKAYPPIETRGIGKDWLKCGFPGSPITSPK